MGAIQRSAIGLSYAILYQVNQCQSPTLHAGNGLGRLSRAELVSLLDENGLVEGPNQGYFLQRFEKLDYGGAWGTQGRFELKLNKKTNGNYELFGNVYWKINRMPGVTRSDDWIIDHANQALKEYWGAPENRNYLITKFELLSRRGDVRIPIIIQVLKHESGSPYWTINVFPDSATKADMFSRFEVVWVPDFSWNMRETYTFSSYQRLQGTSTTTIVVNKIRGRGPHEVGHMIGIPHDISDRETIMSTLDDELNTWRYYKEYDLSQSKHKDRKKPYTAHFKLFKTWAEIVFKNKLDREEDFCIRSPYE